MPSIISIPARTLLIAVLSGFLLFAAWPMISLEYLIFIAFVPLLIIEAHSTRPYRFFFILLLNFLIWNTATTWWIWNASEGGALGAIIANSILMTIPWMLFRITKQKLGNTIGYVSLVLYWLTYEYIHHNWGLSWPWLTLGNAFANLPEWVKWYQFTGTTGGSLWVLVANILIFITAGNQLLIAPWTKDFEKENAKPQNLSYLPKGGLIQIIAVVLVIGVPIVWSAMHRNKIDNPGLQNNPNNIVLIQPNIDPYEEKFSAPVPLQIEKLIKLSESQIDSNTRMVVWPETAVPTQAWENQITNNEYYQPIFAFAKRHPKIMLVTGIDSYVNHGTNNPGGFSIRNNKEGNFFYEAFNTAMALDSNGSPQLYHKSKLVPGVESLPSWLAFLGKMFEDYGGISGTLGTSEEPMVFSSPNNIYKPAPVICYESIYSEYVSEYVRKGANVITIITNDGWWGNTPGYKQHQSYARLRAIETGCWVVRSANTGISCFISPHGDIYQSQPWDTEAAIKMNIPPVENKTFYVQHGDWISRIAWVLAAIVLVWTMVVSFLSKRKK